jgi:hypothetical protein
MGAVCLLPGPLCGPMILSPGLQIIETPICR